MNLMDTVATFDPTGAKLIEMGEGCLNTDKEAILENVSNNIRLGLPQCKAHPPQRTTAILVCGGPSLLETKDELRDVLWETRGKVIAVNGAYNWCIDNNIMPSAMVMLDARRFNARFVERAVPRCKYLLASACHPEVFEVCRDREVHIWHCCSAGEDELALVNEFYFNNTWPVTLGTTVGLRAISLMRMLGFCDFEIFGLDSCWFGEQHHAYDQPENKRDRNARVWVRPEGRDDLAKCFTCSPWHIKQADDFVNLIRERGEMFRLNVHGRGLIAAILENGVNMEIEELAA